MDYYLAIKRKEFLSETKYRTGEYYAKQNRQYRESKFHTFHPYLETKIKLKQRSDSQVLASRGGKQG